MERRRIALVVRGNQYINKSSYDPSQVEAEKEFYYSALNMFCNVYHSGVIELGYLSNEEDFVAAFATGCIGIEQENLPADTQVEIVTAFCGARKIVKIGFRLEEYSKHKKNFLKSVYNKFVWFTIYGHERI